VAANWGNKKPQPCRQITGGENNSGKKDQGLVQFQANQEEKRAAKKELNGKTAVVQRVRDKKTEKGSRTQETDGEMR